MNRLIPWTASVLLILIGCLFLLIGGMAMTAVSPGDWESLALMRVTTAVCVLLSGLTLALANAEGATKHPRSKQQFRGWKLLSLCLLGLVIWISTFTLLEYTWVWVWGLNPEQEWQFNPLLMLLYAERMGVNTALCFVLMNLALYLLLVHKNRIAIALAQGLTSLAMAIALYVLLGYLFQVSLFPSLTQRSSLMAMPTAVSFWLLGIGILGLQPHRGLMQTLMSPLVGGVLARRFLPWAIALPPLLNRLLLIRESPVNLDHAFNHALQSLLMILLLVLLIGWAAYSLNHSEANRRQVKLALRVSEERLRLALDAAQMGIWDWNLQTNQITWTQRHEALFGLAPGGFDGSYKTFQACLHPEDRARVQQQVRQMLKTGNDYQNEYRVVWADGSVHWIEVKGTVFRDAEGRAVRMLGTAVEVTERRQAEAALRQVNERLEQGVADRTQELLQANQRLQILSRMTQRIRQSLDLDLILNTTVAEVRQLLQSDRVVIYQFFPDHNGVIAVESVRSGCLSILGELIYDNCFENGWEERYRQGQITTVDDLELSTQHPCYIELLRRLRVRANLVVPILQVRRLGRSPEATLENRTELWGLLIAHQCEAPRHWQDWEVSLLGQLAAQVGIAIQQSELYQQTRQHAQREQSLNRVFQTVRNSLDLQTVFHTAAFEITQLLQVDRALILQYVPEAHCWQYVAAYCQSMDVESGWVDRVEIDHPIMERLRRLEVVCVEPDQRGAELFWRSPTQPSTGTCLLVPLQQDAKIWGSLTLTREHPQSVWQDWEVELAQALGDQVAIAIQQSELYTQLEAANRKLQHLATHDELTGVANRRYFDDYLNQEWLRSARERLSIALILCDIDHFKQYNDTYGHLAGDACLIQVASAISCAVKRPADLVARYGGEEFAVILPNTDDDGALQVAQQIQSEVQRLRLPHRALSPQAQLTVSLGVATLYVRSPNPPQTLINRADDALYQAKRDGRNCCRVG